MRLGLRARAGASPAGRLAIIATTGLGLATVVVVVAMADRQDVAVADPVSYDVPPPGFLTHDDGTPIINIHPYSSTGEPLTGVLLYDQDGRPIDDLADGDPDGGMVEPIPDARPRPDNAYPQPRQVVTTDEQGEVRTVPMTTPSAGPISAPGRSAAPMPTEAAIPSTPAADPTP